MLFSVAISTSFTQAQDLQTDASEETQIVSDLEGAETGIGKGGGVAAAAGAAGKKGNNN